MAGKIFYRERRKVEKKEKKPRFKVTAWSGVDINFSAEHFRKKELEAIASAVGADLVPIPTSE